MTEESSEAPESAGLARLCLLVLGILFTVLGTVGAFVPVLPTTPFLLLAATCFARSSPALHRRLLANRVFGPYLSQWHRTRTIPREAKRKAYGVIVITFTVSIILVEAVWLGWTLGAVGLGVIGLIAWLPTGSMEGNAGEEDQGEPPA